jgi:hypothetical protein
LEEVNEGVKLFPGFGADSDSSLVSFLQRCLEERELTEGASNAVDQAAQLAHEALPGALSDPGSAPSVPEGRQRLLFRVWGPAEGFGGGAMVPPKAALNVLKGRVLLVQFFYGDGLVAVEIIRGVAGAEHLSMLCSTARRCSWRGIWG